MFVFEVSGFLGKMFLFIGIYCWVFSYDDIFEDFVFMIFFLLDMGSVFWKLVILECKY